MTIETKLFNLSGNVIEEGGDIHTVSSIIDEGGALFSRIKSRSLVLLLCNNQYESIFFYLNSIIRDVVVLLMDADSDFALISELISIYHFDFIFLPTQEVHYYGEFKIEDRFRDYSLLKNNRHSSLNLHPDLALLLSTSGTTGSPKLVRLSLDNIFSNASSISEYLGLTSSDTSISNLPMNYSFGLSIINSHLHVGGSVVMTNVSITQRRFWDLFKTFSVTSLSGVPYTFEILKKFRLLKTDLPSLKVLTQAGGKLPNDLIKYFAHFAIDSGRNFFIMYGQTEGTARLAYLPCEFAAKKFGSIGIPIPKGKFHIIDEKANTINQPGAIGELVYTGPNVMLGYAECMLDLASGDNNRGVLFTGDMAFFDEEGFYYVSGRKKRFIKIFGNRVNLDDLESLLFKQGIESACVGNDDNLTVFLIDETKVFHTKEFFKEKIGIHPNAMKIKVINDIPRNSSGKVMYSKLFH